MKRYLLLLLVVLFWGCGTKKTVELAYLGNLSGRGSDLWVHARNGLELAIDEYNQGENKFEIQLVPLDDEGDPDVARVRVEEALDQGISIIIGPSTSGMALALEDFFSRTDELLFLSATVSSMDFYGLDDGLIRTSGTANLQGMRLAQAAIELEEISSFAIVQDMSNQSYTDNVIFGFNEILRESGLAEVDAITFNSAEDRPFVEIAEEISQLDVQGVLFATNDLDAAGLIQQIHKLDEEMVYLSPSWANTAEYISSSGRGGEGSYQLGFFNYGSQAPAYLEFRDKYREVYSMDPVFTASRVYELFQFLDLALEHTGNWDHLEIAEYMLTSGGFQGLQEFVPIDEFGDTQRNYKLIQIQDGKAVFLE